MSELYNDDIYKQRGKTRQNLKFKDKKKKLIKDYDEARQEANWGLRTYKQPSSGCGLVSLDQYENALPKKITASKIAQAKTRKPLVNRPKNLPGVTRPRTRTESPPPKNKRDRNGKNKGKPRVCTFCRPEIAKRMYSMFDTKLGIKADFEEYLDDSETLSSARGQNTNNSASGNIYENFCCNCCPVSGATEVEMTGLGGLASDQMNMNCEPEGQLSTLGSTGMSSSRGLVTQSPDFSENEDQSEFNDFLKVNVENASDASNEAVEGIGQGWEFVDC